MATSNLSITIVPQYANGQFATVDTEQVYNAVSDPDAFRGYTGSTGAQGPIGYTGSQGVIGYTGSLGGVIWEDGTAANPGAYFANDTNTGLYRPANDQIGFTTGGVSRGILDEDGVLTLNNRMGIGSAAAASGFRLSVPASGSVTGYGVIVQQDIANDVTSDYSGVITSVSKAANSNINDIFHFRAAQRAFGAGATATRQYGYYVANSLTSATNNYGFYGNVPVSGTSNWNAYMNGSAPNYFSGAIGIGSTSLGNYGLRISKQLTGSTTVVGASVDGVVQSDALTASHSYLSQPGVANTAFTIPGLNHFSAYQGTIGSSATVTNQRGLYVDSSMIGALNNYGVFVNTGQNVPTGLNHTAFYTNQNNSTAGGTTWAFYGAGTAPSYFAGQVGIGTTSVTNYKVRIGGLIDGGSSSGGLYVNTTFSSNVTSSAIGNQVLIGTSAAAYTLATAYCYYANPMFVGSGSTINNVTSYYSSAQIDGTINCAFLAGNGSGITTGKTYYSFRSESNAATGGGTTWAFYGAGTADSYMGGSLGIGSSSLPAIKLRISGTATGGTTGRGIYLNCTYASDVTSAYGIDSRVSTATNTAISSMYQYFGTNPSLGSNSSINTLHTFYSDGITAGSTVNIAFRAGNAAAITSGKTFYGFYSDSNIATGGGTTWAFYSNGTAPSYHSGSLGIGSTSLTGYSLRVSKAITGSTTSRVISVEGSTQSDVTSDSVGVDTSIGTAASSFTLARLIHFRANQTTLGAGSSVTTQYGFAATASLTGANTNYGFWTSLASGPNNNWAFYGSGDAPSYFGGQVGIGTSSITGHGLRVGSTLTGASNAYAITSSATFASDVTSEAHSFRAILNTASSAYTVTNAYLYSATAPQVNGSASITNVSGFYSDPQISGTNNYSFRAGNSSAITTGRTNYSFYTNQNIATGGGTTWAFYGAGSAPNYFGGNIGLGSTTLTNTLIRVSKAITGSSSVFGVSVDGTIQSDATTQANMFSSQPNTVAANFTIPVLRHFYALPGTIGSGSSINNQAGFWAHGGLVQAANNYGFYSASGESVDTGKTHYAFYTTENVATGGGTTWAFYGAGTAPSLLNGPLSVPSDAYASGWNGSNQVPTKDAIYDKIESLPVFEYTASGFMPTTPTDGMVIFAHKFGRAVRLPSGLTNSQFEAITAATSSSSFTINKNGSSIGSLAWAASGTVPTVTFSSDVDFAAGDILTVVAPTPADTTLSGIMSTFSGTKI